MNLELLALPAVILVMLTASMLLVSRDWRWSIGILALQYVGVFILIAIRYPLPVALAKLVAGWMAGIVLAMALVSSPQPESLNSSSERSEEIKQSSDRSNLLFRLLGVGIIGLVVASLVGSLMIGIPGIEIEQAWGALFLIGVGLLQLGLTTQPLNMVIGLLTILAGFELLYVAVEVSALVTGLLAGVNLGLALVGAYLFMAPGLPEVE